MPLKELCGIFPKLLGTSETITSEIDGNYNCVSWAIKDKSRWWEPFGIIIPSSRPPYYWHDDLPINKNPQTIISFFAKYGFCLTENSEFEEHFEKIAIYIHEGKYSHVARQLPNGRWTSKLGGLEDIEHDLTELENDIPIYGYGKAQIFMAKKIGD
jgi:hypothetical protein